MKTLLTGGFWNRFFFRSHRVLGIFSFAVLALWSASGLLHPTMTWLLKKLPLLENPRVAAAPSEWRLSLAEVLAKNGIRTLIQVKTARVAGQSYYRVVTEAVVSGKDAFRLIPGPAVYLNTRTGERLESGSEKHAEELARNFSGINDPILSVERLENFTDEYRPFRKVLPVYRVAFSDPERHRIFVDPELEIAVDSMDRLKSSFNKLFSLLHTYTFLEGLGPKVPHVFTALFALSCFYSGVSGLYIYFRIHRRRKAEAHQKNRSRSVHAVLGLVVSFQLLLGSFSGLYHALHKVQAGPRADLLSPAHIPSERLRVSLAEKAPVRNGDLPLRDFRVIQNERDLFYILVYGLSDGETRLEYFRADNFSPTEGEDARFALDLARSLHPEDGIKWQTAQLNHYDHEYEGFSHKYLPVQRASPEKGFPHLYIHTLSSRLAEEVKASDFWEDLSFDTLHKFGFMDFIGHSTAWRMTRDALLSLFTLGLLALSLVGLFLVATKRTNE